MPGRLDIRPPLACILSWSGWKLARCAATASCIAAASCTARPFCTGTVGEAGPEAPPSLLKSVGAPMTSLPDFSCPFFASDLCPPPSASLPALRDPRNDRISCARRPMMYYAVKSVWVINNKR
jgi:hypothetical protein